MRRHARHQGFTLIELAIVLGVLAVIIAGIWMVVAVTYENVRQYQANRELQTMVQNIRALEMRITHFVTMGDITAQLDNQSAFPVEMRVNEGTATGNLNNPWSTKGDSVHVFARTAQVFGVEFKNVPKKACIQVATKLSSGELSGLTALVINGATTTATNLPLTLVGAATKCDPSSAAVNTIEWQFTLGGGCLINATTGKCS